MPRYEFVDEPKPTSRYSFVEPEEQPVEQYSFIDSPQLEPITEEPPTGIQGLLEKGKALGTDFLKRKVGEVEALGATATGLGAAIPRGFGELAGLPFGKSAEFGEAAGAPFQYEPRTQYGRDYAGYLQKPFELAFGEEGVTTKIAEAPEALYEKTVAPLLTKAIGPRPEGEVPSGGIPDYISKGTAKTGLDLLSMGALHKAPVSKVLTRNLPFKARPLKGAKAKTILRKPIEEPVLEPIAKRPRLAPEELRQYYKTHEGVPRYEFVKPGEGVSVRKGVPSEGDVGAGVRIQTIKPQKVKTTEAKFSLPPTRTRIVDLPLRKEVPVGENNASLNVPMTFKYKGKQITKPRGTELRVFRTEKGNVLIQVGSSNIGKMVRGQKVLDSIIMKKDVGTVTKTPTFKEPGYIDLITPQWRQIEHMGVAEAITPKRLASESFDRTFGKASTFHQDIMSDINTAGGTTRGQKIKARVRNKPTKAVEDMSELLNMYEEAPEYLPKAQKDIFTKVRNYTREVREHTNKARVDAGFEPIRYKKGYLRHEANAMAKEMMSGKYPFPEDLKYWMKKSQKSKYFNPTEFERKMGDDLHAIFTKDLKTSLDSMAYYHLKEQLLTKPQQYFKEYMKSWGKDMPAETRVWLNEYNSFLDKNMTLTDIRMNKLITGTPIKKYLNLILKPFGRTIGRKPLTSGSQFLGRLTMAGTMGPRPKLLLRNLHQKLQTTSFVPTKHWLKAWKEASPELRKMIEEGPTWKGYTGFEDTAITNLAKVEQVWHGLYQWTAKDNVFFTEKAAFYSAEELVKNPKYAKHGWASKERINKGYPKDMALTKEELGHIRNEMTEVVGHTQYLYTPQALPKIFRHKSLAAFTRLTSWPMNYFFGFQRGAMERAFTGKPLHGAGKLELPPQWRYGHWRYMTVGGYILKKMGYSRSYWTGVLPDYLTPVPEFLMGVYDYTSAETDGQRKAARKRMQRPLHVMKPGALLVDDLEKAMNEGKPIYKY